MNGERAQKDTVLQTVMGRLEEWAEWYSRGQLYGLGYPSSSLAYRALMEGGSTRSPGLRGLPAHPPAEEIERWVCEMGQQNPLMAGVLRCHYFHCRSLRKGAQRLEISHMQFKLHLEMAHQWLAGRFSLQKGQNKRGYF
jgi:hypothetical protein